MLALFAGLVASLPPGALASEPAFDLPPRIKVEVGAHSGFVKKLAVSDDGTLLLSVSDDRTARVWDARTGRLRRTLRVPIGIAAEGKLSAAAFTRDGRFAVVGGFTGLTRGPGAGGVIYFFEVRTGEMVFGIDTDAPFAIENLEFSHDGEILAICQSDGQGVRFYDWKRQQQLHLDLGPKDKILGADFAADGSFALTTVDGWLRVYSAGSGYREARALQLTGGRRPMHVKYSPDGRLLAVGFDGDPVIGIVDARELRELRSLRVTDTRQRGLHVVDWSADGTSLLAGGETNDPAYTPIYRFDSATGSAPPRVVATLARRVSDLRRLRSGHYAFSSGEPEIGVADGNGNVLWRTGAATVLGHPLQDQIQLSADGSKLSFRSATARRTWRVDFDQPNAEVVTSLETDTPAATPPGPELATAAVNVEAEGQRISIAGRDLPLDRGERVNTWTIDAATGRVLVGTTWSLRLADRTGTQLWRWSAPEEAQKSTICADGRVAVTFFADGTLRWTRLEDGSEVLALLPHRNGVDWVAWMPDGYYMSSVEGDQLVGWQLNNGMAATPDFYRAVQFERVFYRPDVVREQLRTLGRRNGAGEGLQLADLRRIAPPRLRIDLLATNPQGSARLRVAGARSELPMRDWTLFVDGIPVTSTHDRRLAGSDADQFSREVEIPLFSRSSTVRIEAFNGTSLGIAEEVIEQPAAPRPSKGRLFIAAVGVADYADPGIFDLTYPPHDAEAFADRYAELGRQTFSEVRVLKLTDLSPLKPQAANLDRIQPFFAEATGADTVVLFLASHGFSDPAGNYYFLPQDARMADIEAVLDGKGPATSLVGWQYFFDLLRGTAGRRLLIVDTCSSGNVGGTFDVHSLAKRSMASSFGLLTASAGSEQSQEKAALGHGIFTYGLLQALEGASREAGVQPLLVREAFDIAFSITQREHVPSADNPTQTPQRSLPDPLESMAMLPAGS